MKNRQKGTKAEYVLVVILSILAVFFTCFLMLNVITKTAVAGDMSVQKMIVEWEKPISSIILLAVFAVPGFFVIKNSYEDRNKVLFFTVLTVHVLLGFVLVLFARSAPGGDAAAVYNMAAQAAEGDMGFFTSGESYLSYYPQQIGLTVFLSVILREINAIPYTLSPHHAIKVLYVLMNAVSLTFGYLFVKEAWENDKITAAFLYISFVNLPFIMYSSFIYGEIPSFCAMSVCMYFLLRYEKRKGPAFINIPVFVIMLSLSVFLRKNSLIFVIAVVISLILTFLKRKKAEFLIVAAVALILALLILPATIKIFENKTERKLDSGVTMYSYLAMGMQESERGQGWYNGFNFDTYKNTGMDTKETNRISSEAIKERVGYFKENPKEALKFYIGKFRTQWCDPTLASCQATYNDFGGRSSFFTSIYDGKLNSFYVALCNMFQNAVCIGAFIWSMINLKNVLTHKNTDKSIIIYLGIITVLGGFIFHMIWEANSRYIFPYAMLLVPYGAAGLGEIFSMESKYDD
ncbi:MAG: hypothetical protein K6G75_10235 [Lachnospiraceae bacterium]|nr:hypothetical protein [Lachnospiraceae bacterium]